MSIYTMLSLGFGGRRVTARRVCGWLLMSDDLGNHGVRCSGWRFDPRPKGS
jgi:hypothetical protein